MKEGEKGRGKKHITWGLCSRGEGKKREGEREGRMGESFLAGTIAIRRVGTRVIIVFLAIHQE